MLKNSNIRNTQNPRELNSKNVNQILRKQTKNEVNIRNQNKIQAEKNHTGAQRHRERKRTSIIDHDIADKLLVDKATEHDHLRFADADRCVTTENPKNNNQ